MKKIFTLAAAALVALGASAADYYLVGAFNGWTNPDPNTKFVEGANGIYTLDYTGSMSGGFKITDGTWTDANCYGSNGSKIAINESYALAHPAPGGDPGNIQISGSFENPHFEFDPAKSTLLVTGQAAEITINYVLHGDFFGSGWTDLPLTKSGDNWTLSNQNILATEFGIKSVNAKDGMQIDWYSSESPEAAVVLGTPLQCTLGGTNFSIGAGTYNFTFNPTALTLTVTEGEGGGDIPTPGPGDTDYSDWWVNVGGPFNGNDFFNGGVQPVNGIAEFELLAIGDQGFKVKTWDGSTDVYYVADTETVPTDKWIQLYVDGYDTSMTIEGATAGEMFYLWFNVTNNQMMVSRDATSSVKGINIEDGEAQYFNLQGVRVANPENGIFIRVQNGKAVKIVK